MVFPPGPWMMTRKGPRDSNRSNAIWMCWHNWSYTYGRSAGGYSLEPADRAAAGGGTGYLASCSNWATSSGIVPILDFGDATLPSENSAPPRDRRGQRSSAGLCVSRCVSHVPRRIPFSGLQLCSPRALPMLHLNDYPADPPIDQITTVTGFIRAMASPLGGHPARVPCPGRGTGAVPLELFNRNLWKLEALEVARTGLSKMKEAVARSLATESTGERKEKKVRTMNSEEALGKCVSYIDTQMQPHGKTGGAQDQERPRPAVTLSVKRARAR